MPKVICKLENASREISGVKFTPVEGGMLSEDVSDEMAELFVSINGYEPHVESQEVAAPPAPVAKASTSKRAAAKAAATPAPVADAALEAPAPDSSTGASEDGAGAATPSDANTGADNSADEVF